MSEETATEPKLPKGFTPVNVSGQQNWIRKGPGVVVQGILKGRFKRSKGNNHFYQIKATMDNIPAVFDKEEVQVMKGDLICVDETKALEALEVLAAEKDQAYEVYIAYIEKVPNPSDPLTTFWRMEVGSKAIDGEDINF